MLVSPHIAPLTELGLIGPLRTTDRLGLSLLACTDQGGLLELRTGGRTAEARLPELRPLIAATRELQLV
jgi:hypothetical protein